MQTSFAHLQTSSSGSTDGTSLAYIEPDGSISDGDDHIWSGDHNILKGGGGWQKTFDGVEINKILGKHRWESMDIAINPQLPPHLQRQEIITSKTMTQTSLDLDLVETIDLTMSSSSAPENDSMIVEDKPFYVSSNAVSGSLSPVEYGRKDEEEIGYLLAFFSNLQ